MLSAAVASGSRERQAELILLSYRMTAFFAIPASLGITLYAKPILGLLFPSAPDAVNETAPLLAILGASVFLSCMIAATHSVLHAYRQMKKPILSLAIGAVVKVIVAYFLIGDPKIGILGAPISTLACNAAVVLLNLLFAQALCPVEGLWRVTLKPLFCTIASVGIVFGLYSTAVFRFGEHRLLLPVSILTTAIFYGALCVLTGTVTKTDLQVLPGGKKLSAIFNRQKQKGSL